MPRQTINSEADAAKLLANCMVKLIRNRGEKLNGNDLHALNKSVEVYLYAKEVARVVESRGFIQRETGITPEEITVRQQAILKGLGKFVERKAGKQIAIPVLPQPSPIAKPQTFRVAERNMRANADTNALMPPGRSKKARVKLAPSPRTVNKTSARGFRLKTEQKS